MRWTWLLAAGAAVAALAAAASCGSLPKAELEERLLALEKNAPVRAAGLERRSLSAELDGVRRELELVALRVPARGGDGSRLPVVLVHGTPGTLCTWSETIYGGPGFEGLAARRDVVALEIAGHGVAPGDVLPLTFQACADFVRAALRELGLERVHLVGNSYGGEFAWRAALDAPQQVASLALIHASGYAREDGDWLPEEEVMRENALADLGWRLNSRERVERALAPHYRAIPPERVEEMFLVCENAANWRAMIDLVRDENGGREAEIADLAVPTLVLWGDEEIAYPLETYGRRFAADVPGAELAVLASAGHYPHEEHPGEVVAELERFFAAVEAR